MAENQAKDIALNIQSEVKTQGLSELQRMSNEVVQLAGSGQLAAESLDTLNYVLETLQNSKGLSSIRSISQILKNTLSQAKQLASLTGVEKDAKFKELYQTSVTNVVNKKQTYGQAITSEEVRVYQEFKESVRKFDDVSESLNKTAESMLTYFEQIKNTDPKEARKTASVVASVLDADSRRNVSDATKRQRLATAEALEIKNTRSRAISEALEKLDLGDEYNEAQIKSKIALSKIHEMQARNMEIASAKKMYMGKGLQADLRAGLMGVENRYAYRGGAVGFFSRIGSNLARNTKFGDALNMGVAGAGVNLGGIAGGAIGMAIAAAAKGLWNLAKSSVTAAANMEKLRVELGVVYGKQAEADNVFENIKEYALKSPFGVKQTTEQAILLRQSGVADYELMDTLKMLGDVAGGSEAKMTRMSNALAQISSNEIANTRLLKIFTMAGVPIYDALSRNKGVSTSEVRNLVQGGEIKYDDVIEALKYLTGPKGSFHEAVTKGAETYAAKKINYEDAKEIAKANFGEAVGTNDIAADFIEFKHAVVRIISEGFTDKIDKDQLYKARQYRKRSKAYDEQINKTMELNDLSTVRTLQVEKISIEKAVGITFDQVESIENKVYTKQKLKTDTVLENKGAYAFDKSIFSYLDPYTKRGEDSFFNIYYKPRALYNLDKEQKLLDLYKRIGTASNEGRTEDVKDLLKIYDKYQQGFKNGGSFVPSEWTSDGGYFSDAFDEPTSLSHNIWTTGGKIHKFSEYLLDSPPQEYNAVRKQNQVELKSRQEAIAYVNAERKRYEEMSETYKYYSKLYNAYTEQNKDQKKNDPEAYYAALQEIQDSQSPYKDAHKISWGLNHLITNGANPNAEQDYLWTPEKEEDTLKKLNSLINKNDAFKTDKDVTYELVPRETEVANDLTDLNKKTEELQKLVDRQVELYNQNILKQIEEMDKLSSKWKWGADGKRTREYTDYEKSYFSTNTRVSLRAAEDRLRGSNSDNTTSAKYSQYEDYWEKTAGGKVQTKAENERNLEELKKVYEEIKTMGLKENRTAFAYDSNGNKKSITADEMSKYIDRYMDVKNATSLTFENEETFVDNQAYLVENIDAFAESIKASLVPISMLKTGTTALADEVGSYFEMLKNSDRLEDTQNYITQINNVLKKVDDDKINKVWSTIQTVTNTVDIDTTKFVETGKSKYDQSYVPLLRELTQKYLGVSLFRTIGADLGVRYGEKLLDSDGKIQSGVLGYKLSDTLKYAENVNNRQLNAAIASSLLAQKGDKKVEWKDIARVLPQVSGTGKNGKTVYGDDFYKYKAQSYDSSNGRLTRSYGRKRKGYIDQGASADSLTYWAMQESGSADTIRAMANAMGETVSKYNQFFVEAFTSQETREMSAKRIELEQQLNNLKGINYLDGTKEGATKQNKINTRIQNIKDQIADLDLESPFAQLGTEEGLEYRERVTALSLRLDNLGTSSERFSEIMLQEMDLYTKELKARKDMISVLADMRQVMEDLTNESKENRIESIINGSNIINHSALDNISTTEGKQDAVRNIINILTNPEYAQMLEGEFGGLTMEEKVLKILDAMTKEGVQDYSIADKIAYDKTKGQRLTEAETKRKSISGVNEELNNFYKNFGTLEEFLEKGFATLYNRKDYESDQMYFSQKIKNNMTVPSELEGSKKDPGLKTDWVWFDPEVKLPKGWHNDFATREEFEEKLTKLYEYNLSLINEKIEKSKNTLKEIEELEEGYTVTEAIAGEAMRGIIKPSETNSRSSITRKFRENAGDILRNPLAGNGRFSFRDGYTLMYGDNTSKEQSLIDAFGLDPTTSYQGIVDDWYFNNGKLNNVNFNDLVTNMSQYGIDTEKLTSLRKSMFDTEGNLMEGFDLTPMVEMIREADSGMLSLKKTSIEVADSLKNLATSMESAFDSAIVDAISNSMETLGANMRTGADATEDINKGLRETFTNLVKNLGPQMTEAGLAIAVMGAKEGKAGWGKVMGGLGLAAAGGFLSWAGGFLGADDDKDEDAQKEARLKQLSDILSDLIGQARTDAEYYERTMRHEQALSTDYGVSARSVNDMILTPEGTFSTHPEDTIMAMKHPEDLMGMGGSGSAPKVTINIINQSGDSVQISQTSQKTKSNGDIDIEAVIVAVTADAIANGDMDGAFAQREARQRGVTRMY